MNSDFPVFDLDYDPRICGVAIDVLEKSCEVSVFSAAPNEARLLDRYLCRTIEAASFVVTCLRRGWPVPRGVEHAGVRAGYLRQMSASGSMVTS
jgi:hypothetical protein